MIVTTAQLFKHAYGKYAVGAYNINNAEQAMGLFRGSIESQAPFIIQISKGARKYTDKRMLEAIIRAADQIFPEAIFAVHLDHGDEETCYDCINSGFYSSVMIDASHEPFDENVAITEARRRRRPQEGHLRRGRTRPARRRRGRHQGRGWPRHPDRIPAEAEDFVKKTGCDSLACAIGTSHGAYKFKGKQSLHFEVLKAIQKVMPGFPLVMHGSSSVPQDEVARINAAGGKLGSAVGVDVERIPARRQAGRDQDQHRHRRTPGLDPRPPRVLPRQADRVRFPPAGQDLHGRIREVHREPESSSRERRPAG